MDFTGWAHIVSSEGFQISSSNHRLSCPSEFSVLLRYEGIVGNLPSSAVSPLSFAFPVPISICCAGLHLSPALSFYISWKVAPLTPTHASYSINKSYWRDWEKRKEAKKRDKEAGKKKHSPKPKELEPFPTLCSWSGLLPTPSPMPHPRTGEGLPTNWNSCKYSSSHHGRCTGEDEDTHTKRRMSLVVIVITLRTK